MPNPVGSGNAAHALPSGDRLRPPSAKVTHKLSEPLSGRVGLWPKADSYVLFGAFEVKAVE